MTDITPAVEAEVQPQVVDEQPEVEPRDAEGASNIDGTTIETTFGDPSPVEINEAGEAELARREEASPKDDQPDVG